MDAEEQSDRDEAGDRPDFCDVVDRGEWPKDDAADRPKRIAPRGAHHIGEGDTGQHQARSPVAAESTKT